MSVRGRASARHIFIAIAVTVVAQAVVGLALLRYGATTSIVAALGVAAAVVLLLAIPLAILTSRRVVVATTARPPVAADPEDGQSARVWLTGVKVALVVGTLLNLINQGGAVLAGRWSDITGWLTLMNYLVPFLVASYGGFSATWQRHDLGGG